MEFVFRCREPESQVIGSGLLRLVRQDLCARSARLLLIETSRLAASGKTLQFYAKHGYDKEACIAGPFCGPALDGARLCGGGHAPSATADTADIRKVRHPKDRGP